jgi:hypothetical protein
MSQELGAEYRSAAAEIASVGDSAGGEAAGNIGPGGRPRHLVTVMQIPVSV